MKKIFFLIAFSVIIKGNLNAQNFVNEFGKVTNADVDYAFYPNDKSAEAVVIYDNGETFFTHGNDELEIEYERTTRIKIFKESGTRWANVEIPLYREGEIFESVYGLEAYSYNVENGVLNKTKLDLSTCHDEKLDNNRVLKKFAIPNVKAGSIIEYKYIVTSQYFFNFPSWNFQWEIPVIYSRYVAKMIPFYEYTWILQGTTKLDSQKSREETEQERQYAGVKYHNMVYEFIMKDVPAFNDEEFISTYNDYIIKLNMQLSKIHYPDGRKKEVMSNWTEMINNRLENTDFGYYISKATQSASKFLNIKTLTALSEQERFDSIMNYVKINFKYDRSNASYASKTVNDFIKTKVGNNADINLFTIGLLKACGIKANPVILSTRQHGKIKYNFPFNHFFNYVSLIADIDGKKILGDATQQLLQNNRLPEKCINEQGLIIEKDKTQWVLLQTTIPSRNTTTISMDMSSNNQKASIESTSTEYIAYDNRYEYGDDTKSILKNITKKGYNVADSTLKVQNQNKINQPYKLKYVVENKPEIINGKMYVSPLLNEVIKDNPLKQQSRSYPLDMIYPEIHSFNSEITIPTGHKIEYLPEDEKISNESFEFIFATVINDNKITVNLSYSFKQSVYPAEDYSKIKYYFNEIIKKGNDKIVLVKK